MPKMRQVIATKSASRKRLSPASVMTNCEILEGRPVAVRIWTTTPMIAMTTAIIAIDLEPIASPSSVLRTNPRTQPASPLPRTCWISPTSSSARIA